MMHGYLAFDKNGELLVPFRTWQNTNTSEAHEKLSELFQYNIPERWSIAHLYQAVLNDEEHIGKVDFFTTLAGYVHWKLTGKKVLGVGDASGMFPIDPTTHTYETEFIEKFNAIPEVAAQPWKLADLLPEPLVAGTPAGTLTEEGAKLLDPTGTLQPGITFAPPEGDAGTGMVATNSVRVRTGNVSAGTSIFAMVVLEHKLERLHPEVDLVTTPAGDLAGMSTPTTSRPTSTHGLACSANSQPRSALRSTPAPCMARCSAPPSQTTSIPAAADSSTTRSAPANSLQDCPKVARCSHAVRKPA